MARHSASPAHINIIIGSTLTHKHTKMHATKQQQGKKTETNESFSTRTTFALTMFLSVPFSLSVVPQHAARKAYGTKICEM